MVSSIFHHLVPAQDPCFISQNILSTIPHTLYTTTTLQKRLPVGSSCERWAQYYCPRRLLPPPAAEGSGSHHAVTGRAVSGHTSPSNHLILCHPLFLLPSILPSIRVFSNESALRIRWPKYWSFTRQHSGHAFSFRLSQGSEKGM